MLLQGDVMASFRIFPATIPILITFLLLIIHLRYPMKHGARILLSTFALSAGIMVINFSLKLTSGHLFH